MFYLPKKKSGMTFVELIVVVAIINILLVAGQPSYVAYVQEKHADNVKLQMFNIVTDLERIKGRYYSYEAAVDDGVLITNSALMRYPMSEKEEKRFDIEITDLSFNTFKIKAIPTDVQGDSGTILLEQMTGDLEGYYDKGEGQIKEEWY